MARDDIQVNVRLPAELKDRLDDSANRHGRSLTAEVVLRLANSFSDIDEILIENRRREMALLETELRETEWLLTQTANSVGTDNPKYEELRKHLTRLLNYQQLVDDSLSEIFRARGGRHRSPARKPTASST